MNVNYLCRFNVFPVDEYSSIREKVKLSTRVQFSLLISTLVLMLTETYDFGRLCQWQTFEGLSKPRQCWQRILRVLLVATD